MEAIEVEIDGFLDHAWIELPTKGGPLLVGCVYRSPSDDTNMEQSMNSSKKVANVIKTACQRNKNVIIAGDFNYKEIDWINEYAHPDKKHLTHFLNTLKDCYLYQHVTEPTRYRVNQTPNLLDLILSSEEGMVQDLQYLPALGESDHVCLRFKVLHSQKSPPDSISCDFDIRKTNYEAVKEEILKHNWTEKFNSTFQENYNYFLNKMLEIVYKHSPKKTPPKSKKNLYMTNEALRLKNKKQKLWKKYQASQEDFDRNKYNSTKNNLRKLTRKLRRDFETKLARNAKEKPKLFWGYTKSRLKTRQRIPSLTKPDGTTASTAKEKADLLNEFFSSVFTIEDLENTPSPKVRDINEILTTIEITPEMVQKKLEDLNPNKTPGYDKCHPFMLKELATVICQPLSRLFNQSLKEGAHETWLKAIITAIYKKKKRSDRGNYRPISITAVISKIIESIVRDAIVAHMMKHNLFADQQHGFVPRRDCITQLLLCLEEWTRMVESGEHFDVIYTDFSKAFDSVPHKRLLIKLESLGIKGDILRWIRSFLTGRTQCVNVEGIRSMWKDVLSGIPQGSVLGPILFVIFINDLPEEVLFNFCKMFADDCKLYGVVNQENLIQADLTNMEKWSEQWQLPFNASKCKVMHFGTSNEKRKYVLNDHQLETSNSEKDLGVFVDNELKFHVHTAAATKKANQIVGVIKRSYESRDPKTITMLYKAMVRPHLEYGNAIWGPFYQADIKAVEAVQHRVTKLIPQLKDKPYEERLRSLELPSLVYRRRRGDMITMYKLMNGFVRIDHSNLFTPPKTLYTRGHNHRVFKTHATKNARKNSFSQRIVNDWNHLPKHVINAPTLNAFKARLDKWWKDYHYETD